MVCSKCKKDGHNIRTCPKFNSDLDRAASSMADARRPPAVCAALDCVLPGAGTLAGACMMGYGLYKANQAMSQHEKKSKAAQVILAELVQKGLVA